MEGCASCRAREQVPLLPPRIWVGPAPQVSPLPPQPIPLSRAAGCARLWGLGEPGRTYARMADRESISEVR